MSTRTTRASRPETSSAGFFPSTFKLTHYAASNFRDVSTSAVLTRVLDDFLSQMRVAMFGVPAGTYIALDPGFHGETIAAFLAIQQLAFTPYIAIPDERLAVFGVKWFLAPNGREAIFNEFVKIERVAEVTFRATSSRWILSKVVEKKSKKSSSEREPLICAYAIATSGTTGTSKLVHVPHEAIGQNVEDFVTLFQVKSDDVILSFSPLTFDPALCDILVALKAGCRIVTVSERSRTDEDLCAVAAKILLTEKVSYMFITPSILFRLGGTNLLPAIMDAIKKGFFRLLLLGGEPIPESAAGVLMKMKKVAKAARKKKVKNAKKARLDGDDVTEKPKFKAYNLYGLTELSCWAAAEELTAPKRMNILGSPLTGVRLFGDARVAPDRIFELIIDHSGGQRGCVVLHPDGSVDSMEDKRLPTGDLFQWRGQEKAPKEAYHSVYYGRKNGVVKLFGQRIDLLVVDETIANCIGIPAGQVCSFVDDHRVVSCIAYMHDEGEDLRRVRSRVFKAVTEKCGQASVPTLVLFFNSLPVSTNGKIDLNELLATANGKGSAKGFDIPKILEEIVKETLGDLQVSMGNDSDEYMTKSFKDLGGNSIGAMRVQFLLETKLGLKLMGAFEFLMAPQKPLSEVLAYIEEEAAKQREDQGPDSLEEEKEEGLKVLTGEAADEYESYKKTRAEQLAALPGEIAACVNGFVATVVEASGRVLWSKPEMCDAHRALVDVPLNVYPYHREGLFNFDDQKKPVISRDPAVKPFKKPHDLRSCVDVGLCLLLGAQEKPLVYAAGHHGRVLGIPALGEDPVDSQESGIVDLTRQTGLDGVTITGSPVSFFWDRDETCSAERRAIVFGDSSGNLYCSDSGTGDPFWAWEGGRLRHPRASPVVLHIEEQPRIIFGCSDKYLRCVLGHTGELVFETYLGGFLLRGSPAVAVTNDFVYCGTSIRKLFGVDPNNGEIKWVYSSDDEGLMPAAPNCHQGVVVCATIQGRLFGVHGTSGERLWRVFLPRISDEDGEEAREQPSSSPMVTPAGSDESFRHLVLGTQGGSVVCYRIHASMRTMPEVLWRMKISGCQIYANPCWWQIRVKPDGDSGGGGASDAAQPKDAIIYVVCSSDGVLHLLDSGSGESMAHHFLPEAVFSTPVMIENKIYIGCRDNHVHCLAVE